MKLRLLEDAETDREGGAEFYESRASGLGAYFVDCLSADIGTLRLRAGIHPIKYSLHRMLSKRFPYSIYYRLRGNEAIVVSVFSDRMNPTTIISSLNQRRE